MSEEHNPSNEKGVSGVEVFVPSSLLATGMCLVDTPGIASVSAANTAATGGFVPHIDAALVVLGADPPISGAELALVEAIAGTVQDVVFVLNKADRLPEGERAEAVRFTARVLGERLGRPVGPILQVSAAERLGGEGPARDWDALVLRLESLVRDSGADLVRAAEDREARALVDRLLVELDQQRSVLTRPLDESETSIELLRRAIANAERALEELGPRMTAVQDRLMQEFTAARDAFLSGAIARARRDLGNRLADVVPAEGSLRIRAPEAAADLARQTLDGWRHVHGPHVDRLYRDAMQRFVSLFGELYDSFAAMPGLTGLVRPQLEAALTHRSGLYYTEMLTVAPVSAPLRFLDVFRRPEACHRAVERDAIAYLERLLEVNTARITNDLQARVRQSRRDLEADVRRRLGDAITSAERALAQARQTQEAGALAVQDRLQAIAALRARVDALGQRRR